MQPPAPDKKKPFPIFKTLVFIVELLLVGILLVLWFSSESIQQSKNLWVLFLYCFPAEFLIAIVPHEPVILYFGKFYPALTVALITSAGTLLTETLNYSVFQYVTDSKLFKKLSAKKTVSKLISLFNKAPFIALMVAGFTPIPFYPFRFLVVMARYPVLKYLSAVFLSRTPRFFILALIGKTFKFPDWLLVALFAVLILVANFPLLRKLFKKKQKQKSHA
ncbi:MAG: VTT domain-containing protein [Candidatus Aminicenantes bacterium]|nr:VTT domain-containing protein [Candidatus Aminicenantes bacterium]